MSADQILRKLRKLDANMVCPNCETKAPHGVGFGNVCVKFKTFVCDLCKTSHQAISHRVKSITMSNWTMDEVNELLDKNSGGNAAAAHVWLAKAPRCGQKYPGGARPKEGDRVEIFKQFVMDAYEYGKFRADTPYVPGESGSMSVGSSESTPVTSKASSPTPLKRALSGGGSSVDNSRTSSPQVVKLPSQPAKPSSSFDAFGDGDSSSDPFGSSSAFPSQSSDPFGFSSNQPSAKAAAPVPAASSSRKNPPPPVQQSQPNLIDFSDPAPVTTSTKSSVSLLDAFGDMSFGAPPVPAPAPTRNQQPPIAQPPIAPAAPAPAAFDPFGSDFITPVGSGASSPVRANIPQSNSNPNFNQYNNANAYNWQSQSPASFQQPPPHQPYANPAAPPANNNILDLFSGMTYDPNTSGKSNNGMQQSGYNNNNNNSSWGKPSPMMQSASAISQIDVFANAAPAPAYGGGNSGRWNGAPVSSAYGARPMAPAPGRPMMGMGPPQIQPQGQGDKFDFVKQHLQK